MFITLKQADSGAAITLNVGRIVVMYDAPEPSTGTIVELTDGVVFRVDESRALIMAELRRLRLEREDAPADNRRAGEIADAVLQQIQGGHYTPRRALILAVRTARGEV